MLPEGRSKRKLRRKPSLIKTHRVAPEVNLRSIQLFFESLDCPRALTASILLKYSEYDQLLALECNPLDYSTSSDFRMAYAATMFLSKFKDFPLDIDRDIAAFKKFDEFELLCRSTNASLKSSSCPLNKGMNVWLHNAVKRKIADLLGAFPFEEWLDCASWGPGSSTRIKGRDTSASRKFREEIGITRDLYWFLCPAGYSALGVNPQWYEHLKSRGFPRFEVGNEITTVDKNAKINRVIAIEPGLNLFFQLSIGDILKRLLLTVGVDLRHQSRNQNLAKIASKTGDYATIDFSSASDSISLELIRELLPTDWFAVMDACRSHYGVKEGLPPRKWEKFSSMGNGFTFELESLIFYAAAVCCVEACSSELKYRRVSVYGDDVILPCKVLDLFIPLCTAYGFRVNADKSFSTSDFRESCGSHYWNGMDVKPIYLKDRISSVESIFKLANNVRRFSRLHYGCDRAYYKLFRYLCLRVPKVLRLRIPNSLGDGGFISNFDEACPDRAKFGIEGYLVKHVTHIPIWYDDDSVGKLYATLHGLFIRDRVRSNRNTVYMTEVLGRPMKSDTVKDNKTFFRRTTKPVLVKSLVPMWEDLGPWI